jgi:hypothetical protein
MPNRDESEAEQYYRHKNAARRKRKVFRAGAATACCGIPCLLTSTLILGLMSATLLLLVRI